MKIEHIAVYVRDIEKSALFFEKYFNGMRNQLYQNKKTGFSSYFLSFSDGSRLELMHDVLHADETGTNQTGYAHIAFSVGSKENVLALTEQLRKDGCRVLSEPRTTGDGYFESCIADAEGNQIEITI